MLEQKKLAYFLPNLFTAFNLGCGFFSILESFKGHYYSAAILIVIGVVFDLLDGRVARLLGAQSLFGEQFDSLSDLVTFALAPSLLFYQAFMQESGRVGIVVSFFYCLSGALRLARFNANINVTPSNYFQGLPSPGAAMGVVGYILFLKNFESIPTWIVTLSPCYLLFYSILMVTSIPFPSFKKSEWINQNKKKTLFFILTIVLLIITNEEMMLFIVISSYVLISIFLYIKNHKKSIHELIDEREDEENEKFT